MAREAEDFIRGSVGYFWPQNDRSNVDLDNEPLPGSLSRSSDEPLLVTMLTDEALENWPDFDESELPEFIVGITDKGRLILENLSFHSSSISSGRASTVRYRVDSFLYEHNADDIAPLFRTFTSEWHGISRWAGVKTTSEESDRDEDGRITSYRIGVRKIEEQGTRLSDLDADLQLSSGWQVTGPVDSRTVSAPLRIALAFDEGRPLEIGTRTFVQIRDLLTLAFQGFVTASGAYCHSASEGREKDRTSRLWSREIMERPPGLRDPKIRKRDPIFYLDDIGGLPGVGRWIHLHDSTPQIVRPIITPLRLGPSYAESILVEVGTAIDYWRGVNARKRSWATGFQPLAVANSLGSLFNDWVEHPEKWSELYWYHYTGLKHYVPNYKYDSEAIYHLANSAIPLLTCIALQEISEPGCDAAVKRALSGTKWNSRGAAIRRWLSRPS